MVMMNKSRARLIIYVLTMDMIEPIADNGGRLMETSQQPEGAREIADAVGNNTEATTKCVAVSFIALASLFLFRAYMDEVSSFAHQTFNQVDIAIEIDVYIPI